MIKKYNFLLFLLSIIACNPMQVKKRLYKNDPRVVPYILQWQDITYRQQSTPIIIVPLNKPKDANTLGICWYTKDPFYRHIELNENYYDYLSDAEKLELVMHELGHCDMDKDHDEHPPLSDGCPYSIMDEYLLGTYCFNKHFDHYINEYLKGIVP